MSPSPAFLALEAQLRASEAAALAGRHGEGVRLAAAAVQMARESGSNLAEALSQLALHQLRVGALEDCLRSGHEALTVLGGAEHAPRALLLCTISMACRHVGLNQQALQHAGEALRLAQQADDAHARAWALNRLGCAHADFGDQEESERLLNESLQLGEALGDEELQFAALNNMAGRATELAGQSPQAPARPHLLRALQLLERASGLALASGNAHRQGLSLVNLAEAQRACGEHQASLDAAMAAQALAFSHGLEGVRLYACIEEALTHLAAGRAEQALLQLQALLPALPEGDVDCALDFWGGLVEAQRRLGLHEEALGSYAHFHALALGRERLRSRLNAQLLVHQHELEQLRLQAQRARLESEMQRMRVEQLRREAYEDALTGLYNRRFVDSQLGELQQRAQRQALPLWVAVIDADHFKAVNDGHGHRIGDEVLRTLGRLIREHTRVSDLAARLGGEEFVLLMPDTLFDAAREVCERLRRQVEAFVWSTLSPGLRLTISIGLAAVGARNDDALDAADAALYRAKAGGRNCVVTA